MLSQEQNDRLTQIGSGTPMGNLLRRYWYPVAAEAEFGKLPLRRRLLGEDIVVYRDLDGSYGAMAPSCPHRNASLEYGIPELGGLRCAYHGWKFDASGQCTEQPAEPAASSFKTQVRIPAYPAEALGGLVWVYMGPAPKPLIPRYDLLVWDDSLREIGQVSLSCNFMQIMENSVDPHHVEWLHGKYPEYLRGEPPTLFSSHAVKIGFDLFEYGIIKRRLVAGQTEESDSWKIGHPLVFPNILRVGSGGNYQMQIRVPVDDCTTHIYYYTAYRPLQEVDVPPQTEIPVYDIPLRKADGSYALEVTDIQDMVMWMSQGKTVDRTVEKLATSDQGIGVLRRLFLSEMDKVKNSEDPICVVRDPAKNVRIELPQERHAYERPSEWLRTVVMAGQSQFSPMKEQVLALFEKAEALAGGAPQRPGTTAPRGT